MCDKRRLSLFAFDKNNSTAGRKYPIPPFESIFPTITNPFMENKDKIYELENWWFEYSLLPRDHYWAKVGPAMVRSTCCFFPYVKSMEKFELMFKWIGYLFVWDDHNETPQGQFGGHESDAVVVIEQYLQAIERLEAMYLSDKPLDKPLDKPFIGMSAWKPYVLCVYALVEEILHELNPIQKRRFLSSWRLYIEGQFKENQLVVDREDLDFDGVSTLRMATGAVMTCYPLVETGQGLYVPEREWTDTRLKTLRDLCNKAIVYTNDVYSFEKELYDRNGCIEDLVTNVVAYYVLREDMPISEAMEKVIDISRHIERQFKAISDDVFNDNMMCQDTKVFVRGIEAMISANVTLSLELRRYNQIY